MVCVVSDTPLIARSAFCLRAISHTPNGAALSLRGPRGRARPIDHHGLAGASIFRRVRIRSARKIISGLAGNISFDDPVEVDVTDRAEVVQANPCRQQHLWSGLQFGAPATLAAALQECVPTKCFGERVKSGLCSVNACPGSRVEPVALPSPGGHCEAGAPQREVPLSPWQRRGNRLRQSLHGNFRATQADLWDRVCPPGQKRIISSGRYS